MAKDNQPQISVPLRAAADSTKVKRFYNSGDGGVNTTGFGEYISQSNNVANDGDTGNLASKLANAGAIGSIGATLAAITGRVGVNAAYSGGKTLIKPIARLGYGAAAVGKNLVDRAMRKEAVGPISKAAGKAIDKAVKSESFLGKVLGAESVIVGDKAIKGGAKLAKFAKYSNFLKNFGPLATIASAGVSAIASNAALHGKYDPEKLPRYNTGELGKEVKGYRIGSRAGLVNPDFVGDNIVGAATGLARTMISGGQEVKGAIKSGGKAVMKFFGVPEETAEKISDTGSRYAAGILTGPLSNDAIHGQVDGFLKQYSPEGDIDLDKVYGKDTRGRMMADLFVRAKLRGMEGVPNSYLAVNEADREAAKLYKEGKLEKAALDQTPAEIFYNPSKERGYNKDPMMNMAAYYPGDDRYPVYMHTLRQAYAEKHAGNNPNSAEYKKFEQVFDSYLSSTATKRGGENEDIRDEMRKEAFDYYHQKRKAAAEKRYEPIKK